MNTDRPPRNETSGQSVGAADARIPFADPRADLTHLRAEIVAAITRVVDSGHYVLGSEVKLIEENLAKRIGVAGAIGVGSGTDAIVLALLAVGVGPGDEVITVSHTAGATVAAIRMIGAVPVLVDVVPATYCLDPGKLEAAASMRTKAILPVHLYGHPADLGAICAFGRSHGVPVVEDCAQAQEAIIDGRPVGSIGEAGCFSFYPTKTLGAIGDGGLVSASSRETYERVLHLRTYGWVTPQFSDFAGGRCSRLDELQAAILNVKLAQLSQDVEKRRAIAKRYDEAFVGLPIVRPTELPGYRHVYHLYVIRAKKRDALAQHLDAAGISTGMHYQYPVHVQPGLMAGARVAGSLAVTETIVEEILSLPIYPSLSVERQDRVIAAVRSFFAP